MWQLPTKLTERGQTKNIISWEGKDVTQGNTIKSPISNAWKIIL